MLFDSHCHLNFKDFKNNLDEIIKRSQSNIGMFLNIVGIDYKSSLKAVKIAEKYGDKIFASIGIHPTNILNINDFNKLEKITQNHKVIAIGECGLDYTHIKFNKKINLTEKLIIKKQKELFLKHIDLAIKVNKPLIIHCREAHKDMIEILSKYKNKLNAVIHCFTGTFANAIHYLKLNCHLSFTGIITFTNQYDSIIKNIPIEKILIETDAPFLTPVPFRGKQNQPMYVEYVAKKIAEIKNKNFNEIAKITTQNALKFFHLS